MKRGGPLKRRTPLRRNMPLLHGGFLKELRRVAHACPPWADQDAIREVYREARELQELTDQPHHVDHIVPLKGMWRGEHVVCGLHVAENLRAVPSWFNQEKGNRWRP